MTRGRIAAACLLWALLMCLAAAQGAPETEITAACRYTATVHPRQARHVITDDYSTYWIGTGGALSIALPEGTAAQGLQLSFFETAVPVTVEALDADGAAADSVTYADRYLNAWISLPSAAGYRIAGVSPADELRINRVQVFAGGAVPDGAQTWQDPAGPVDLLHIVTHPDDELVWFGGLLPTYAGERGMNVLVAYAAVRGAMKSGRLNELLDGLWVCGVRTYPVFGPFADFQVKSIRAVINRWGEGAAEAWCTGLIRRYRPSVVVTQDIRGESGHMQHQTLALAVIEAVTVWSGDARYDPDSAAGYGVYTPLKLYIHRYRQNEIFMDWDAPLSRFGGKSGTEVAREAFKKHVSQRRTHYHIYVTGPLDSRYLGLYYTAVGEDAARNDLFEHIDLEGDR